MALTKCPIVSVVLVLLAAGQGTDGSCNFIELMAMQSCYTPYIQSFFDAFGRVTGTPCNTTRITKDVCCWLSGIVKCLKGKDLDEDTCYSTIASTIDSASVIPCKVQQLFNACPNAPCIAQHGQNCEAGNNKTDDCQDEDETNEDSDKDETNDDSDKDETNDDSDEDETNDDSDEDETNDDSDKDETNDDSDKDETNDDSDKDETNDDSDKDETNDDSDKDETNDDSDKDETNDDSDEDETNDDSDKDETNDDSDEDETNDDSDEEESNVGKHKGETKDGPYNCAGMSASPILWLTSLMATCLAVLWAARSG